MPQLMPLNWVFSVFSVIFIVVSMSMLYGGWGNGILLENKEENYMIGDWVW